MHKFVGKLLAKCIQFGVVYVCFVGSTLPHKGKGEILAQCCKEGNMKKLTRIAAPLIAVAMMTSVPMMSLAQNSQIQNSSTQDWNTPPAGTEQAQTGYRDGIEAAKLDKAANRKIDAKSSYLYQHPRVKKGPARDEYLSNFEAGYNAAVQHGATS